MVWTRTTSSALPARLLSWRQNQSVRIRRAIATSGCRTRNFLVIPRFDLRDSISRQLPEAIFISPMVLMTRGADVRRHALRDMTGCALIFRGHDHVSGKVALIGRVAEGALH